MNEYIVHLRVLLDLEVEEFHLEGIDKDVLLAYESEAPIEDLTLELEEIGQVLLDNNLEVGSHRFLKVGRFMVNQDKVVGFELLRAEKVEQ